MKTTTIREHLHRFIDKADDTQIAAIYTLLEEKVEAVQERTSLDQYNIEIHQAETRIDSGTFYTQEQIIHMSKK